MATLTALKFPTANGAEEALETVRDLAGRQLIQLHDAAIVTWPVDKRKPKTRQLNDFTGAGALSGSFWGLLFGMLFFVPLLGMAVGAALGALSGSLADVGIDDKFIRTAREQITPGTSALFLMTTSAVEDKVIDEMRQHEFEILSTSLSNEEEERLRAAFADEQ